MNTTTPISQTTPTTPVQTAAQEARKLFKGQLQKLEGIATDHMPQGHNSDPVINAIKAHLAGIHSDPAKLKADGGKSRDAAERLIIKLRMGLSTKSEGGSQAAAEGLKIVTKAQHAVEAAVNGRAVLSKGPIVKGFDPTEYAADKGTAKAVHTAQQAVQAQQTIDKDASDNTDAADDQSRATNTGRGGSNEVSDTKQKQATPQAEGQEEDPTINLKQFNLEALSEQTREVSGLVVAQLSSIGVSPQELAQICKASAKESDTETRKESEIISNIESYAKNLKEYQEKMSDDPDAFRAHALKQFAKMNPHAQVSVLASFSKYQSAAKAIAKEDFKTICLAHLDEDIHAPLGKALQNTNKNHAERLEANLAILQGQHPEALQARSLAAATGIYNAARTYELSPQTRADREKLQKAIDALITDPEVLLNSQDISEALEAFGNIEEAGGGYEFLGQFKELGNFVAKNKALALGGGLAFLTVSMFIIGKIPIIGPKIKGLVSPIIGMATSQGIQGVTTAIGAAFGSHGLGSIFGGSSENAEMADNGSQARARSGSRETSSVATGSVS